MVMPAYDQLVREVENGRDNDPRLSNLSLMSLEIRLRKDYGNTVF
jgi:hypothetical protein